MQRSTGRASFDRLMLESLPAVQRFAIRLTGDIDLAEEIAQETVVRAARSWKTFHGGAKFQTWLFQIAVNAFRDHIARRRNVGELPEEFTDDRTLAPGADLVTGETSAIVAKLVSRLPARQREVLVLIAYEQMDQRDVARVLGISDLAVRTSLHHARERLKQQLMPYLSGKSSP